MYIYIHEAALHTGKYASIWNRIEARLNNLGIHGRKVKITPLTSNVTALLKDELRRGAHTVVVVGNDQLFLKVANAVMKYPKLVTAYIPLKQSYLSKKLGLQPQELACDILSSRILKSFSAININDEHLSLAPIELLMDDLKVADGKPRWILTTIEPSYKLLICADHSLWNDYYQDFLSLNNVFIDESLVNLIIYNNKEEKSTLFQNKLEDLDLTILRNKKILIKKKDASKIDIPNVIYSSSLLEIKIKQNAIRVVVGKNRKLD
jgi:diacylglycerol kinase family enzyme